MPEYEVDELIMADAEIEDTVHCDLCGASWWIDGIQDGLIVTLPSGRRWKICHDCADFVALSYQQWLAEKDVCEHGVIIGEWCAPCNEEYKRAIEENEFDDADIR